MNNKQKVVIVVAIGLVLLSGLYVPFEGHFRGNNGSFSAYMGYFFIWEPPDSYEISSYLGHSTLAGTHRFPSRFSSNIVVVRVLIPFLTILLVSLGLILVFGDKKRKE